MVGQISGILFILGMDTLKDPATGSMAAPMTVLVLLSLVSLGLAMGLKEPKALTTAAQERPGGGVSAAPPAA